MTVLLRRRPAATTELTDAAVADVGGQRRGSRVADVPAVQLQPPLAQRVLAALLRPGDEAVQRDRYVAGGVRHREPPELLRRACGRVGILGIVAGDGILANASGGWFRRCPHPGAGAGL